MKFVPMNLNVTLHQWMYSNATPLLFQAHNKILKAAEKAQQTINRH